MNRYQRLKKDIKNEAIIPIDVVFMSGDGWYRCVDEDANLMHQLFNIRYSGGGWGYYYEVSFECVYRSNWIKKIKSEGLTYAFARICDGRTMTREIIRSSDRTLLHKKFH